MKDIRPIIHQMITNVFLFLVPPYIPYEGIKIANMRLINYCDTYNSLMTRCSLPKYKTTNITFDITFLRDPPFLSHLCIE